nr:Krueppel homolog 1 isoform X1 [Bactrocera oleae]
MAQSNSNNDKSANNGNNWRSKQNWIKDVLSKSGTELMEITTTTTPPKKTPNDSQKTMSRRVRNKRNTGDFSANVAKKETPNKMVYHQSSPLVIKTEKLNQAQFCTPLQTTTELTSNTTTRILEAHQLQQGAPFLYSNNSNITIMQQQQQLASTSLPHTSIIPINVTHITAENKISPGNIKAEPNIDIYGTAISGRTINATATTLSRNGGGTVNRKQTVNKPKFKCEQCGMTFGSKSAHTSHTKSHAKSTDLVGASTAESTRRVEINEAITPAGIPKMPNMTGDPYQCNVCQKTFAVPARLIRHYRTHTGERPFECEFCHKLFSVKENLQVHRRIHTKERPYKCDVCDRAFEHSGKLHRHMRIHTGERPHKCSVCEKTFIQSGQLVIHMRTHTGEKPYKCPVAGCGKGFTCSKQLKVHSRTHTGEKPYHCDICYRDFGYNHVLKLHRVQHYGSKCYKCTICDRTFGSKKEMEAHIKGHAKELPDNEDGVIAGVVVADNTSNSASSSSSGEASSAPASPSPTPASPSSATPSDVAPSKPRKTKRSRVQSIKKLTSNKPSPNSPRSTISPSSSLASTSRLSDGVPESMPTSPQTQQVLEIDHQSRDSGVASASNNRQLSISLAAMNSTDNNAQHTFTYLIEDLPTDLSKQHPQTELHQLATTKVYPNQTQNSLNYHQQTVPPTYSYHQLQQQRIDFDQSELEPPTINPALLEAASIVRRRDMLDSPRDEEVTFAGIQFKQTRHHEYQNQFQLQHRSHDYQYQEQMNEPVYDIERSSLMASPMPTSSFASQDLSISHDLSQYDDTREANELIEHYKRGELARHGLHKGYAPVPKYEPSLLNNEIVRQVEAAIAPLRSSTESPERSSSPESDSMMMADRDIMTLPLRKRKLYMHEGSPIGATALNVPTREMEKTLGHIGLTSSSVEASHVTIDAVGNANHETDAKVMRMSSVIQFAKAS